MLFFFSWQNRSLKGENNEVSYEWKKKMFETFGFLRISHTNTFSDWYQMNNIH